MSYYSNKSSFLDSIPVITKNILIINLIIWFATFVLRGRGIDLNTYLGLHYWQADDFIVTQLVTYMFMHDTSSFSNGIAHIFFNMFSLWMFGSLLERVMGAKRFLFYYLVCGVGAALVQELVWHVTWASEPVLSNGITAVSIDQARHMVPVPDNLESLIAGVQNAMLTVGASGAVFGILLAFGMLFPNMRMYIIPFPFPIKAKWLVIGYGAVELVFGLTGSMSNVAHYAHLGGMLFGFLLILYWKHNGTLRGYEYVE